MKNEINQYIAWKSTYAPRASVNYPVWLNKFDRLINKAVGDIDIDDVIKYRRSLAHYSPYTIQFAMVTIKSFLRFQRTIGVACLSPELIKSKHVLANSYKAIPEEDYQKLISYEPTKSFYTLRDYVIIRMLHDTGMRVSELCDLNIPDIDVSQASAVIATKKTVNKRMVMWSAETHQYLLEYLSFRKEVDNGQALFLGRKRRWDSFRLSCRTVERVVKVHLARAGVPDLYSPHSFRHARAHAWRDNGAPISFIQQGLGHNHPISSFRYLKDDNREFERNAKRYFGGLPAN